MNFSQWLQEEMQKNNLTEYRIAKLSGVHQTTIKNLLRSILETKLPNFHK